MSVLDEAIRAGCPWYTCDMPSCNNNECINYKASIIDAARVLIPRDPPSETLEQMFRGGRRQKFERSRRLGCFDETVPPTQDELDEEAARYRAQPAWQALWGEK